MRKLIPIVFLFLVIIQTVSAVIMDPSVDYVAGNFTLNSRSSIDVPSIDLYPDCIDLGAWGNITFLSNFSSSEDWVEVGKGYLGGSPIYTTVLSIDAYAPADWTIYITYDFTYFYMYNLTSGVWTNQTFPQYIWNSDSNILGDDSVENFLSRGGVYSNVDFVFRDNGALISWWKDAAVNDLTHIDDEDHHPEYDYFIHPTGDDVLQFIKPRATVNMTGNSYWTQFNTTHRRYSYTYNPANSLDIDTSNYTGLTMNISVYAYNDTLKYRGYSKLWNITNIHEVGRPYGSDIVMADYNVTWSSVNISWTAGNNSDTTVVVQNNNTWPTTPVDGWVVQNTTSTYYNVSPVTDTRYYSLFGYNATTHSYSPRTLVYWGALQLWNCYNESNPAQAINYSIEITNANASDSYVANNIGNNHMVDLLDIPYGDNTVFTISNSSYKQRVYYYDLTPCHFYNYSFYLPPLEIPGGGGPGGGENITHQYWVNVIDDYGTPVQGAKVTIKRYINTTDEYTTVAVLLTDSYGQASVWLLPEAHYKVWIDKNGYLQDDPIPDWFPDPIFYGANYPKTFQLTYDITSSEWPHMWDVIRANATKYENKTINIQFQSIADGFQNIQFYTYEYYNGTLLLNATNTSVISPRTFWITGINITRLHHVVIHLNHTGMIDNYETATLFVQPIRTPEYNKNNINTIVNLIVGPPPIGNWVDWVFLIIPALFLLVVFGKSNPEIGIAFSCGWIGIVSLFVGVPDQLVAFAPVGIVIAGIVKYVKHGGKKT